ncbi:dTDP-4-dehydrorhamnose 3,5-epimerase [uncultured archaeon]|nr:dTDP-4-dehydrorhamnose 3,5-epimerase [uncultured archaeon]
MTGQALDATELTLKGAYLITPFRAQDARGEFAKFFTGETLSRIGAAPFTEEFMSVSHRGVVRGFHYQRGDFSQARLVWCPKGEVFDVIADLRESSPTFGKTESVSLSGENMRALYIPRGFAHAFQSLADGTMMVYKTDRPYSPENERGIIYSDRKLGVKWPVPHATVSKKDLAWPAYSECEKFQG